MFTNKTASYYSQDKVLIEAACLSTDTKPTTGVANGSKCIEMDTGKKYMFNEEDSEWEELPSSGGGGGGGSSDFSIATMTVQNDFSIIYVPNAQSTSIGFASPSINCGPGASTTTVQVVLYQGVAAAAFIDDVVSISGDIEYDSDEEIYIITGDCTVTIDPHK